MSSAGTLEERYGAGSPWLRRSALAVAGVLAVGFLVWLAWSAWSHSTPQVTSELESFSIEDDHTATAVLVVSVANDDVEPTCTLQAVAEDHSVVGELAFTPDPGSGPRQVQEIRTERRATTVQSLGCIAPGQNRPR